MKRYKLLKDTPVLKAGTIFKEHISDFDNSKELVRITPESGAIVPMWTIKDIENFDEWFEEIPEEYKRWRAEKYEEYWFVDDYGAIVKEVDARTYSDDCRYKTGNCFRTKEEVEAYRDYLIALQIIKDDAKGFEPDWKDLAQRKYWGKYDHVNEKLYWDYGVYVQFQGAVYFASEEDIEESFKNHRKEWLTVLGVKENE